MPDFMLIDAFADAAFTGNPAAVVRGMLDDALMQKIAMEFNQAETAFVAPLADGRFSLRWFTPMAEVSLCGHATLAAARALFDWGDAGGNRIVFLTRFSGELACDRTADGTLTLDFPATPPAPSPLPTDANRVLGVEGAIECLGTTKMNLTLVLENEAHVRAATPNLPALATWHPVGVAITAKGLGEVDFVSRFFGPAVGVNEDPATGSAHCVLTPYWAARLDRQAMIARQLSQRGATLRVELVGDRVKLGGGTVVTARGCLEGVTL
jgi:PhzF family phenazine biosynthesis protein